MTGKLQVKFYDSRKAWKSLMHHTHEQDLSRNFVRAVLELTCTVAQLVDVQGQEEEQQITSAEWLGREMLASMEAFCEVLQAVMALNSQGLSESAGIIGETGDLQTVDQELRLELLNFAKHFEAFWLVHQNWLPRVVLDTVTKELDTLLKVEYERSGCPVRNAVSRVCTGLKAGHSME